MSRIADFKQLLSGEQVTVVVGTGDASETFKLPRALLCTEPWFHSALQRDAFKEGTEGKLSLPEDEPAAFEIFQYWIYHEKELCFEYLNWEEEPSTDLPQELDQCVKAWIFGDKYGVTEMQNAVMKRICDIFLTKKLPLSPDTVQTCYAGTSAGSQLRTLAAECLAHQYHTNPNALGEYQDLYTHGGLIANVLGAQQALHQAPLDFPRYQKPGKFKSLFCVNDTCVDDKGPTERSSPYTYDSSWEAISRVQCLDCLFVAVNRCCGACIEDGNRDTDSPCEHWGANRKCSSCFEAGMAEV